MKFDISKPLPDTIKHKGFVYKLNLSFDRVLSFFDLFNSHEFDDDDKFDIAYSWFVTNKFAITPELKAEIVKRIYEDFIKLKSKGKSNEKEVMSFSQDGGYIYSSFMAEYGIDLFEQQGCLHWHKFFALFEGLSEKSHIKQIMSIRSQPLPKYNGKNMEQIQKLAELKAYYSLEINQENNEKNTQNELDRLFNILTKS